MNIAKVRAEARAEGKLLKNIEKIVSAVQNYDSDAFCAKACSITRAEALLVVNDLIVARLDIGMNVDGVTLTEALDAIRN